MVLWYERKDLDSFSAEQLFCPHIYFAFYNACVEGSIDTALLLLRIKGFNVNFRVPTSTGERTPLYIACKEGHTDIVKELLQHKSIDVNAKSETCLN
uniref:Uncharacterized protein n=1 Tax=Vannella robusta TaxID=1487602 RepID=A0A7S4MEB6_9EUKA